jgi:propanol-preferring alcohol dehydrogenase
VLVALPAEGVLPVPVFDLVLGGKSVIGSIVGTRADLAEVYELHASGRTRVIYETRQLEQVNDPFEQILSGDVPARLVFDMTR